MKWRRAVDGCFGSVERWFTYHDSCTGYIEHSSLPEGWRCRVVFPRSGTETFWCNTFEEAKRAIEQLIVEMELNK